MSDNKQPKFNVNPKKMIILFTIVLFALVTFSLYKIFFLDQKDVKISAIKNKNTQETATPGATATPEADIDYSSYTFLLNKNSTPLDQSYVPSDLADPENVQSTTGVFEVRQEVATQLQAMAEAASNEGITLYVTAGYISYTDQDQIYTSEVALLKEAKAAASCPKAGYSEHQLGLAIDFTDSPDTPNTSESFKDSDACKWLTAHAHEYGFILRYPEGKEEITGYTYAPWHYRYVGVDTATDMYNKNVTMEEYFK